LFHVFTSYDLSINDRVQVGKRGLQWLIDNFCIEIGREYSFLVKKFNERNMDLQEIANNSIERKL